MSNANELVNYQYTEELWNELENSHESLTECWEALQEARRQGKGSIGGACWNLYKNAAKEILYFLARQWDCEVLQSTQGASS